MGTTLTRHAYQRLIDEDLEWLSKQPRTLEREHIEGIVRRSLQLEYSLIDSEATGATPIDMMLFCPRCGTQHVDAPEDETTFQHRMEVFGLVAEPQDHFPSRWTNPPHKSHLCHNCGAVWRPADVATNGARQITTRGKNDNTWTNAAAVPAITEFDPATVMRDACVAELKRLLEHEVNGHSRGALNRAIARLRSLTLDQVKQEKESK